MWRPSLAAARQHDLRICFPSSPLLGFPPLSARSRPLSFASQQADTSTCRFEMRHRWALGTLSMSEACEWPVALCSCRVDAEAVAGRAEALLSEQRYLCGSRMTWLDIRLYMTLVRFDPVSRARDVCVCVCVCVACVCHF
eukprot:1133377-Rhodomonas_salina.2